MISSVRGEVLQIGLDHAVVEVGGVGLAVHATPATLAGLRRGEQARLATALVVREDSLTLFGFADDEERELFGLLQTVSRDRAADGAGHCWPCSTRTRCAAPWPTVTLTTLTRVPGIGPQGRRAAGAGAAGQGRRAGARRPPVPPAAERREPRRDQVVEALVGLGFTAKPAETAVDAVLAGRRRRRRRARCCAPR